MADAVFPKAKEAFEQGAIDLMSDTIKVALLTSTYVYDDAHQFRSSLAGVIDLSPALTGPGVTGGKFTADNVTLPSVTTGSVVVALVGYKEVGSAATDPLIWYNDGFTQATNGGDITVIWDAVNGIFSL